MQPASPCFAVANAAVVLPDRVLDRGTVRVCDGRIADVAEEHRSRLPWPPGEAIDAKGAYLLPGVVDLHNDGLEIEVNPRPRANLPLPFAFASMERRLAAAGVTTEFHAISFMDRRDSGRSVASASERSAYIAALQRDGLGMIDHHVLHRIDVWHPAALDVVFESLDRLAIRYVSLNDHTPGQGQYRDVNRLIALSRQSPSLYGSIASDPQQMLKRMAERAADKETVPFVYWRVAEMASQQPTVISTHDDDSPEKVDAQWEIGATIAEFPVTMEAAQRARQRGMSIVVGAPNVVRGGSQSGNLPAHQLVANGLADVLCADYHAPSVLAAVFRVVQDGLADLPSAVRMVSLNAAQAVGLRDRGAIRPGLRADLVLVRLDAHGYPHVEATYCAGRLAFAFGRLLECRHVATVA